MTDSAIRASSSSATALGTAHAMAMSGVQKKNQRFRPVERSSASPLRFAMVAS